MPLIHISLRAGKPEAYRQAIFDSLYRAMREALDVPEDDQFMTITEHDAADRGVARRKPRHPAGGRVRKRSRGREGELVSRSRPRTIRVRRMRELAATSGDVSCPSAGFLHLPPHHI